VAIFGGELSEKIVTKRIGKTGKGGGKADEKVWRDNCARRQNDGRAVEKGSGEVQKEDRARMSATPRKKHREGEDKRRHTEQTKKGTNLIPRTFDTSGWGWGKWLFTTEKSGKEGKKGRARRLNTEKEYCDLKDQNGLCSTMRLVLWGRNERWDK